MVEQSSLGLQMPRVNIKDFKERAEYSQVFLLKSHSIKTTRTGKPYLAVELCDQTGSIRGNKWDTAETSLEDGSVVYADLTVDSYGGALTAKIYNILEADADTADYYRDQLIPTVKGADALKQIFQHYVSMVQTPYDKLLAQFDLSKMMTYPAAKAYHHSQVGGLLKHTVEVLQLADGMASVLENKYPINRSLLYTAVILHDYGKITEFQLTGAGLVESYTPEGMLIGHITIGAELASETAKKIGMKDEDRMLLEHCILSHHGQPEYGSPVKPAIMEALILHEADALSALSEEYASAAEQAEGGTMVDALGLGKIYVPMRSKETKNG